VNTRRFTAAYSVVPAAVHNSADYRARARFFGKLFLLRFVFFLFYKNICHKIKTALSHFHFG
jgi:hypothetical protein